MWCFVSLQHLFLFSPFIFAIACSFPITLHAPIFNMLQSVISVLSNIERCLQPSSPTVQRHGIYALGYIWSALSFLLLNAAIEILRMEISSTKYAGESVFFFFLACNRVSLHTKWLKQRFLECTVCCTPVIFFFLILLQPMGPGFFSRPQGSILLQSTRV